MSEAGAKPEGRAPAGAAGPAVTRGLFRKWRAPRHGTRNPERMNNPVWEWLVRSKATAYQAAQQMGGASAMDAGPGWSFDRFGQSTTLLADGRVICAGGEHEDHYDPDFHIYNDVVIQHPGGEIEILGYPREDFPPTDFHTATPAGDRLILIGNLGYPDERRPGRTQVKALDLRSLAITDVRTTGTPPGWIHGHTATTSPDGGSILIQHGKLDRGTREGTLVENIDDWRLDTGSWRWERLTERHWARWEVRRRDGERSHLFEYQMAMWEKAMPAIEGTPTPSEIWRNAGIPTLEQALGRKPDLELYSRRYRPETGHEPLPETPGEPGTHRIRVGGVVVRYVEAVMGAVQITVEGELPGPQQEMLVRDATDKLSALENSPCEAIRL